MHARVCECVCTPALRARLGRAALFSRNRPYRVVPVHTLVCTPGTACMTHWLLHTGAQHADQCLNTILLCMQIGAPPPRLNLPHSPSRPPAPPTFMPSHTHLHHTSTPTHTFMPKSRAMNSAPVTMAMSCSSALRRSPKPGACAGGGSTRRCGYLEIVLIKTSSIWHYSGQPTRRAATTALRANTRTS